MRTVGKSRMTRSTPSRRRSGHTLLELVVSVAVSGILLAGIASTLYVATRATDDGQSPWRGTCEGRMIAEEIASELTYATSFAERMPDAVEFTVADRGSDEVDEKIRYAWSGTPGDPLTRQYNGGTVVEILRDVHEFSLAYRVQTVVKPTTRYYLRSVEVTIQAGPDAATRVQTAAVVLNAPEVPSS
jgi:prepilin-type N-terminal cleavage/methylation domain-containing protein